MKLQKFCLIGLGIALMLCLSVFGTVTQVSAATVASGTCGSNLTWTLDDTGTLTISGSGAMKNYSYSSSAPWYAKHTSIKSVVIGNGVTSIGSYAFYKCTSLTSITIPDSVASIGNYTFLGCDSLTSIWVDENNIAYTNDAKGVLFNKEMTTLIQAPGALNGSYTIPNSVTSIGGRAFEGCDSLTSVTIGNGVTSIGSYAFDSCNNLTSITIGDSVTSIGEYALYGCYSLTGIWVDENNIAYTNDAKGVLYNKEMTTLIQVPGALNGSYTIPNSVTSIGDYAFAYCDSLTSVTVGNGVTSIGEQAFEGCYSLTSVTIGNSVTSIGDGAFGSCDSLTSITIPDSVTSIGDYAFDYCDSLKTVYYGGSQRQWKQISIGDGNGNLTSANIQCNHIHDYTLLPVVAVEPTCTTVGYREYTCVFGETYRESIPALGHDYSGTVVVIAPTCAATGHTNTQCIRCDSVQKSDVTDPIGHNMTAVPAVAATCTQTGLTVGTACERCGMVGVAQSVTPMIDHNFVDGVCSVCALPEREPGDLDNRPGVDTNDVIQLLLHVSMPGQFPINGEADFNGDGKVTTDDVIQLLLHVSLPDIFPLQIGKKEN